CALPIFAVSEHDDLPFHDERSPVASQQIYIAKLINGGEFQRAGRSASVGGTKRWWTCCSRPACRGTSRSPWYSFRSATRRRPSKSRRPPACVNRQSASRCSNSGDGSGSKGRAQRGKARA